MRKLLTICVILSADLYDTRIFLAPANDNGISRLSINLARIADEAGPERPHGLRDPNRTGAARLDETNVAQTQTWAFY